MLKSYWWLFPCAAGAGWILGGFAAGIITLMMPKLFESSAIIEVLPPANDTSSHALNKSREEVLRLLRSESIQDVAERFAHERKAQFPETLGLELLRKSIVSEAQENPGSIHIKAGLRGKFDARDAVAFLIDSADWRITAPTKEERIEDQNLKKQLTILRPREIELSDSIHRQMRSTSTKARKETNPSDDGLLVDLSTQGRLDATKTQITELIEKVDRIHDQRESNRISIKVATSPSVSDRPAYPDIDTNLTIGRFSGAGIALILCSCIFAGKLRKRHSFARQDASIAPSTIPFQPNKRS